MYTSRLISIIRISVVCTMIEGASLSDSSTKVERLRRYGSCSRSTWSPRGSRAPVWGVWGTPDDALASETPSKLLSALNAVGRTASANWIRSPQLLPSIPVPGKGTLCSPSFSPPLCHSLVPTTRQMSYVYPYLDEYPDLDEKSCKLLGPTALVSFGD